MISWFTDLAWSVWAAVSTVASVAFILAAGAALFGLVFGMPYSISRFREDRAVSRALAALPAASRAEIVAVESELGPYDDPAALLAAAPRLRPLVSGFGVAPEALLGRILAELPGPEPQQQQPEEDDLG